MRRSLRLLAILASAAIAVPLVPFLLVGTRVDELVARWLDPPPPAPLLAALEIGILAADLLLPVPSSLVATLGGARLGTAVGTACAWLGMTAGAMAGWWLGRSLGSSALAGVATEERDDLERRQRRFGPLAIMLTRPLPLVAEAGAIMAGATGMRARDFLPAAAAGNLVVAAAWSLSGALGREAGSLPWVLVGSLALPVAVSWLFLRRDRHRADRPL